MTKFLISKIEYPNKQYIAIPDNVILEPLSKQLYKCGFRERKLISNLRYNIGKAIASLPLIEIEIIADNNGKPKSIMDKNGELISIEGIITTEDIEDITRVISKEKTIFSNA